MYAQRIQTPPELEAKLQGKKIDTYAVALYQKERLSLTELLFDAFIGENSLDAIALRIGAGIEHRGGLRRLRRQIRRPLPKPVLIPPSVPFASAGPVVGTAPPLNTQLISGNNLSVPEPVPTQPLPLVPPGPIASTMPADQRVAKQITHLPALFPIEMVPYRCHSLPVSTTYNYPPYPSYYAPPPQPSRCCHPPCGHTEPTSKKDKPKKETAPPPLTPPNAGQEKKASNNVKPAPELAKHSAQGTIAIHVCLQCGRPRSAGYHKDHPLFPGDVPEKGVCRRCLRNAKQSRVLIRYTDDELDSVDTKKGPPKVPLNNKATTNSEEKNHAVKDAKTKGTADKEQTTISKVESTEHSSPKAHYKPEDDRGYTIRLGKDQTTVIIDEDGSSQLIATVRHRRTSKTSEHKRREVSSRSLGLVRNDDRLPTATIPSTMRSAKRSDKKLDIPDKSKKESTPAKSNQVRAPPEPNSKVLDQVSKMKNNSEKKYESKTDTLRHTAPRKVSNQSVDSMPIPGVRHVQAPRRNLSATPVRDTREGYGGTDNRPNPDSTEAKMEHQPRDRSVSGNPRGEPPDVNDDVEVRPGYFRTWSWGSLPSHESRVTSKRADSKRSPRSRRITVITENPRTEDCYANRETIRSRGTSRRPSPPYPDDSSEDWNSSFSQSSSRHLRMPKSHDRLPSTRGVRAPEQHYDDASKANTRNPDHHTAGSQDKREVFISPRNSKSPDSHTANHAQSVCRNSISPFDETRTTSFHLQQIARDTVANYHTPSNIAHNSEYRHLGASNSWTSSPRLSSTVGQTRLNYDAQAQNQVQEPTNWESNDYVPMVTNDVENIAWETEMMTGALDIVENQGDSNWV